MTISRLLFALLVAFSGLRLFADDKPAADAPPAISCDSPYYGSTIAVVDDCKGGTSMANTKWRDPWCPAMMWDYIVTVTDPKVDGSPSLDKNVPATVKGTEERNKFFWNNKLETVAKRKEVAPKWIKTINGVRDAYNGYLISYMNIRYNCEQYKADSTPEKADKFATSKKEFDDQIAGMLVRTKKEKGGETSNWLERSDIAFGKTRKPPPKAEFESLNQAVVKWQASFEARGKFFTEKNAKLEAEQKAKVDQFNKDKQVFRDRLKKGDEKAVADELQSAFDKAGVSGVKVNTAVKNADGSVSVNIDMSKDDWDKLGSGPDGEAKKQALLAKLKALGIPDVEIGKDVHQRVRFPTNDDMKSIDSFEKVIFDNKGTLSIKYDSISKTVKDDAADAAVKTALGSSVSGVASDPEKKKELDDKIRKLGNKYNADYASASADLAKDCEKAYADIKALGGDPGPKKKECADKQGQLDKDHAEKARALGEQQGSADVARAADVRNNLEAYRDLLKEKIDDYEAIKSNALLLQRVKNAVGKDYKFDQFAPTFKGEKDLIEKAIAKIPDVQSGKAKLADLADLSKGDRGWWNPTAGCVQGAMDAGSADELFAKRYPEDKKVQAAKKS